ncbi:sulfatase-like hydrolase/transferase [Chondromyces apiculatus]|uniref:Sulfatase n=1 Tax=Chondromyces apiculatus DSM 436 TaxID=1192034 RepID=A0A017SZ94_9BACT|nr:sulfatase-like hydrolase/transferase [Chondromyces apiculatus]EYF01606.1 Sulfatase [Chondromyces apiculatus DSM 436]
MTEPGARGRGLSGRQDPRTQDGGREPRIPSQPEITEGQRGAAPAAPRRGSSGSGAGDAEVGQGPSRPRAPGGGGARSPRMPRSPFGSGPEGGRGAGGPDDPLAARIDTALGWRIADAYLALAVFSVVELGVVTVVGHRELAGGYEVGWAFRDLLPLALAAAAPTALVGGAVVELATWADRPRGRVGIAGFAAGFAGVVGVAVSGGRRVEGLRVPFVAALVIGAGLAAYWLAPLVARALRTAERGAGGADVGEGREGDAEHAQAPGRGPGRRERRALRKRGGWGARIPAHVKLLLVVGAGMVALGVVNMRVLPRLYPGFHLGLGALTLLLACVAPVALGAQRRSVGRVAGALVLFAFSAALTPGAAARLARADNLRLVVLDKGPVLGRVVELGTLLSPPAPLDDAPLEELTSGHAIDLRGRDIVLITVDALRADHVGVYGYGRPTTPNLDRLAAEGVVFEAAYTPTPHTSYAVASLMTGKYMRPLLLQGLGEDSETFAQALRRYGYKTAGFYPPAVFFIDGERFGPLRERGLDFEYRRVEFASAAQRVGQVEAYLGKVGAGERVFLWVHLFEPHEPYEARADHPFGERDVDRYDAEIEAADVGLGAIVAAVRKVRPGAVVIATADHGEEFGEHGGRYHGTTVYEEQARVPLVVSAPGLFAPRRVGAAVGLTDLLPTVLAGLSIPRPARIRGADLGPLLAGTVSAEEEARFTAFAETDAQAMLARGSLRLLCARRVGACALYDVASDPLEKRDVSGARAGELGTLRAALRALEASHGRFEMRGLRREGKGWPDALRRGIAGDGDAVVEVAALLDDADVAIRRKAAEVLFELRRAEAAPALRLALVRDEDEEVRRWSALTLTRLGEGAPLTRELLQGTDRRFRRLAALALAEAGDRRGEDVLTAWLREALSRDGSATGGAGTGGETVGFERVREMVEALGKLGAKSALGPLIKALGDVRLRPYAAAALAAVGEDAARPALAERFAEERYHTARLALAEALVKLGAGPELRAPLVRFLGIPDPLPGGLLLAERADILDLIGGPRERDLGRLRRFARSGIGVGFTVPKAGNGKGLRVVCRARVIDDEAGEVRFGMRPLGAPPPKRDRSSFVPAAAPELDPERSVSLAIPRGGEAVEVMATLPASLGVKAGEHGDFVVYATQNVELFACAVVPLADELPPPPPEPWSPEEGAEGEGGVEGGRAQEREEDAGADAGGVDAGGAGDDAAKEGPPAGESD